MSSKLELFFNFLNFGKVWSFFNFFNFGKVWSFSTSAKFKTLPKFSLLKLNFHNSLVTKFKIINVCKVGTFLTSSTSAKFGAFQLRQSLKLCRSSLSRSSLCRSSLCWSYLSFKLRWSKYHLSSSSVHLFW